MNFIRPPFVFLLTFFFFGFANVSAQRSDNYISTIESEPAFRILEQNLNELFERLEDGLTCNIKKDSWSDCFIDEVTGSSYIRSLGYWEKEEEYQAIGEFYASLSLGAKERINQYSPDLEFLELISTKKRYDEEKNIKVVLCLTVFNLSGGGQEYLTLAVLDLGDQYRILNIEE